MSKLAPNVSFIFERHTHYKKRGKRNTRLVTHLSLESFPKRMNATSFILCHFHGKNELLFSNLKTSRKTKLDKYCRESDCLLSVFRLHGTSTSRTSLTFLSPMTTKSSSMFRHSFKELTNLFPSQTSGKNIKIERSLCISRRQRL